MRPLTFYNNYGDYYIRYFCIIHDGNGSGSTQSALSQMNRQFKNFWDLQEEKTLKLQINLLNGKEKVLTIDSDLLTRK